MNAGIILASLFIGAIIALWKKEIGDICVRVAGTALVIFGLAVAVKMLLS